MKHIEFKRTPENKDESNFVMVSKREYAADLALKRELVEALKGYALKAHYSAEATNYHFGGTIECNKPECKKNRDLITRAEDTL